MLKYTAIKIATQGFRRSKIHTRDKRDAIMQCTLYILNNCKVVIQSIEYLSDKEKYKNMLPTITIGYSMSTKQIDNFYIELGEYYEA